MHLIVPRSDFVYFAAITVNFNFAAIVIQFVVLCLAYTRSIAFFFHGLWLLFLAAYLVYLITQN